MTVLALHSLPILIVATIVGNAVLAVWAFAVHRQRRRTLGDVYWVLLLVVLALLTLQVGAGIVLALAGARPRTWLHILYGIVVAGVGVAQFGLRPRGFVRARQLLGFALDPHSPRGMALICLTQAALLARAYTTGAFGR